MDDGSEMGPILDSTKSHGQITCFGGTRLRRISQSLTMTVNGIDLNRDGIPNVLQEPLVGIRRLYGGPVSSAHVLTTPRPSQNSFFCLRIEWWCGRCGVPCQRRCAGDKDTVRPCLVVSGTEAVSCVFLLGVSSW